MATFFEQRWSLLRAVLGRGLRGLREARERHHLARAVRRQARDEREHCHRAGVIEFASMAERTALYERIAERLEELDRPVAAPGVGRLKGLLAAPPPFRDYGPRARGRNARIESILTDLETEQAGRPAEQNPAAHEHPDGHARAAFRIDRCRRVGS